LYILILFFVLGDTAEAYFSPALIKISDYLRLSPNIAGVTLLALGNGAPDLSTIIIGVFKGSAEIGLGAPIGGGMEAIFIN
jgi:sodium/potassium/calcium exchanger 6